MGAGWAPCVCPVSFFYVNICVTTTPFMYLGGGLLGGCYQQLLQLCGQHGRVYVCGWLGQFLLLSRLVLSGHTAPSCGEYAEILHKEMQFTCTPHASLIHVAVCWG